MTYTFAAVMCLVLCLCLRRKGEEKFSFKGLYAPALGVGACIGICFFSMGRLSGMFPAVVQFTLVTTLSLLLGLTIGWIKYKEKITMKSVVSVICCLAAIALQCFNI